MVLVLDHHGLSLGFGRLADLTFGDSGHVLQFVCVNMILRELRMARLSVCLLRL